MCNYANVGAQSYSFRKFDLPGALAQLITLGGTLMEFCAVHFPPDPEHPGLDAVLERIHAEGITVPSYGVEGFGADRTLNRRKFAFAKKLGAECLSADPEPDSFDNLEGLVDEFNMKVAIHNHGPDARYDKVADTLAAVRGRHPYIGACLDTGHALRSGEAPHEVIEQLGERLISVHLKDWKAGSGETAIGEGDLDLQKTVAGLRAVGFAGFICMEYELDPENPVPGMLRGLQNWRDALAG